jgi:hypothetical protein
MVYLGYKPADKPITAADITDGIITSAKIVDGTIVNADINASAAITSAKLSGVATTNGITEADQWRLSANLANISSETVISSNLERNDSSGFGYIGTGMSQSSGIFTFPSTGYYYISANITYTQDLSNSDYGFIVIQVTTDNSSYSNVAYGATTPSVNKYSGGTIDYLLDVTNTTNVKVKFAVSAQASSDIAGNTTFNQTNFTFIRLGDT